MYVVLRTTGMEVGLISLQRTPPISDRGDALPDIGPNNLQHERLDIVVCYSLYVPISDLNM